MSQIANTLHMAKSSPITNTGICQSMVSTHALRMLIRENRSSAVQQAMLLRC